MNKNKQLEFLTWMIRIRKSIDAHIIAEWVNEWLDEQTS